MDKKKLILWGGGAAAGTAAIAAAAFALAPGHRGLAAMDLNGDGQIVVAEIQQSARVRFAERDANGDGRLTGDELPRRSGHGRRGRGHHDEAAEPRAGNGIAAAGRAARGLGAADVDGDGALDLREFYRGHAARAARADANRDGTISAEELAAHRERRARRRH